MKRALAFSGILAHIGAFWRTLVLALSDTRWRSLHPSSALSDSLLVLVISISPAEPKERSIRAAQRQRLVFYVIFLINSVQW